jgi:hypothetical protein
MLHQKFSWISCGFSCQFSPLSFTNAQPSFLKKSSLPFRASQNASQQLSSARLQNDFKIPFRQLVECTASSKFRVRHQIPCDIFGWPYSLIISCTNSAYNLPNTNSKKGNRNNQSGTSVGSFSTPRLQISTLRPRKLSKGRVNSFYLFGKISTTKTAVAEQRKRHEEQAVK